MFKKTVISEEQMIEMYRSGKSQSSIAKEAGISRERARQILVKKLGQPTGRTMLKNKRIIKAKEKAQLKQQRLKNKEVRALEKQQAYKDKYQHLQDMWEAGLMMKEIEEQSGISRGSLSWIIGNMRETFGWFDKRRPNYTRKK